MKGSAGTDLRALREHPFDLLRELERRSKVALAGAAGDDINVDEWVGIGIRLGEERFVIARDEIAEVLMVPPTITRVPGAKAWMLGLANIRGRLLPVIDLKAFLGSGVSATNKSARVLVTHTGEQSVGIIADEVFGFRRFVEREYSPELPSLSIRGEAYLTGSYRRGIESWPILSMERLQGSPEFQTAAE